MTGNKSCDIRFKKGLNVIKGAHNSGKTNLMEILRFSLGCNTRHIDPIVFALWEFTFCEIELCENILTLKRKKSKSGDVIEYFEGRIEDISPSSRWLRTNRLDWNNRILSCFEIYGDYDRGRKLKPSEISFYMLYNMLYIPQRHWRQIQEGQQSRNPLDRIAVFRFSLDIIDKEKSKLEITQRKLEGKIERHQEQR